MNPIRSPIVRSTPEIPSDLHGIIGSYIDPSDSAIGAFNSKKIIAQIKADIKEEVDQFYDCACQRFKIEQRLDKNVLEYLLKPLTFKNKRQVIRDIHERLWIPLTSLNNEGAILLVASSYNSVCYLRKELVNYILRECPPPLDVIISLLDRSPPSFKDAIAVSRLIDNRESLSAAFKEIVTAYLNQTPPNTDAAEEFARMIPNEIARAGVLDSIDHRSKARMPLAATFIISTGIRPAAALPNRLSASSIAPSAMDFGVRIDLAVPRSPESSVEIMKVAPLAAYPSSSASNFIPEKYSTGNASSSASKETVKATASGANAQVHWELITSTANASSSASNSTPQNNFKHDALEEPSLQKAIQSYFIQNRVPRSQIPSILACEVKLVIEEGNFDLAAVAADMLINEYHRPEAVLALLYIIKAYLDQRPPNFFEATRVAHLIQNNLSKSLAFRKIIKKHLSQDMPHFGVVESLVKAIPEGKLKQMILQDVDQARSSRAQMFSGSAVQAASVQNYIRLMKPLFKRLSKLSN